MRTKIVMLGMMGAGKGTQAKKISEYLKVPHISTGDMFRQAASKGSPLGLKVKKIMQEGALVSDEVVLDVVSERLKKNDTRGGFILDGFPRTLNQAKKFAKIQNIDIVFYLDISKKEAIKRLRGRRECSKCKKQYNIYLSKRIDDRCLQCGARLLQRADDKEETVKKRIKNYVKQTEPLINYYRQEGVLEKINAEGKIEDIFEVIKELLK